MPSRGGGREGSLAEEGVSPTEIKPSCKSGQESRKKKVTDCFERKSLLPMRIITRREKRTAIAQTEGGSLKIFQRENYSTGECEGGINPGKG